MRTPPANTSVAAQRLRLAAINFGLHSKMEPADELDREGQRRNTALLLAAIAYAKHAERSANFLFDAERRRDERKMLRRRPT